MCRLLLFVFRQDRYETLFAEGRCRVMIAIVDGCQQNVPPSNSRYVARLFVLFCSSVRPVCLSFSKTILVSPCCRRLSISKFPIPKIFWILRGVTPENYDVTSEHR